MTAARIHRLQLTNFRSYHAAKLDVAARPGRAGRAERRRQDQPARSDLLSRARAAACAAPRSTKSPSARATAPGRSPPRSKARSASRRSAPASSRRRRRRRAVTRQCRIDREPVVSAAAFADHLRVIWLTPAMDGLFSGPASERRRFLDRLVLAVDAEHSQPRHRARARAALAQPAAGRSQHRSALARRGRARDRRTCGRGRGARAPRP